jgi:hypothetical protein
MSGRACPFSAQTVDQRPDLFIIRLSAAERAHEQCAHQEAEDRVRMGRSDDGFHLSALDAYLEERYGTEFRNYAARTRKFIPFVY